VYLNDYDEKQNEWMVRCLSLATGEQQWCYKVNKRIRPNHGITRSAPATDGGFVFAIDPKCELHCLDARNGEVLWTKSIPAEYGSQIPPWYNGQCPLIDQNRLVVATGGRVLLTSLEKSTGNAVWETENSREFLLSHSSVMPVEIAGVRQYTYTTLKGLVGVDAASGKLLWHFPWQFNTVVTTTPLPLGEGKFFLTSGYHARSVVCQVKRLGDEWSVDELISLPPPTNGWNSEVHTPIVYRDRIYGIGKKQRGLWTCLDLDGNELWTSERKASFGMGGYILADGMFFVLDGNTGVLRVLDADADRYEEIGSFQLLEGPDVWAPPVVSQGKLLIRDLGKLICLDIASDQQRVAASNNR
jgi:outer membrane protein assembly factor BamB